MTRQRNQLDIVLLSGDPVIPYKHGIDGRISPDDVDAADRVLSAVDGLDGYTARHLCDHEQLIDHLRREPPDLALNFCDTGYRNLLANEANVPALLELLEIPYTGAGPAAMHLCGDKAMVRLLAAAHGVPVPNETLVDLRSDPLVRPELYPAIIKPNGGCGSIGVTRDAVVNDAAEAEAYLRWLAEETDWTQALIQDFLTGPEYTIGLVGNPGQGFTVLPPLEIDYSALDPSLPPILTYGSKTDPDSPYWQTLQFRQAEFDDETYARLVEYSTWVFERLGFRDYARIDFRSGADGVPRLLDPNFNPTWTHDGKMALMASWAGYDYPELLGMILAAARGRYGL
ncbi:MAG TPA: ATP-grasp domain-containing protein [Woeseiaceae bacterium]|nr:ATP-grasp domain-containing protein [Woeseiaceae bacterium]